MIAEWHAIYLLPRTGRHWKDRGESGIWWRHGRPLADARYQLYYWRTYTGREVDFILEHGEKIIAVEVKWSHKLEDIDLSGLKDCARDLKGRHLMSVLLYPGTEIVAVDKHTLVMPFSFFFGIDF